MVQLNMSGLHAKITLTVGANHTGSVWLIAKKAKLVLDGLEAEAYLLRIDAT